MHSFWSCFIAGAVAVLLSGGAAVHSAETDPKPQPAADPVIADAGFCAGQAGDPGGRTVCADIVALDQTLVYNRFGSFNPYGMIFALARDVDPLGGATNGIPQCETDTATRAPSALPPAGDARLRDCKRPRPLVLRANVGDVLVLRVTNLLQAAPDFSAGMCGDAGTADPAREAVRDRLSTGTQLRAAHGEVSCSDGRGASPAEAAEPDVNWPRTRSLNFVAQGLLPLPVDGVVPAFCLGTATIPPGESFICRFRVGQEGTHFFASNAAPAGGNGDGGSITHGLFGAVLAERPGSRWYRSQVSQQTLDRAWPPAATAPRHARSGVLAYEAVDPASGVPYLNLAQALDRPQAEFGAANRVEIVHGDLNAIIFCDDSLPAAQTRPGDGPLGCAIPTAEALGPVPAPASAATSPATAGAQTVDQVTLEPDIRAFREFTVFFHDELKTFYTRNFEELGSFGQLAGVRDGFAINYGASGMGTLLLANRKGIGPAATCAECLYEEFFLTSWANGDPALLEWFDDDPSNVHHSYLNDPVVFRNFHAGPKETHVFHLHAHQWFAGNDPGKGSYLDSQTVGPAQGFTYNIYHGGRGGEPGRWSTGGSGNRNRTVGDSIFHCHLYPHFAQGMWALWRVHDVLEDGSRQLPDGQARPGLSTYIRNPEEAQITRPGSVDPATGAWTGAEGTPIPALVPLPGEPLPPLPSYAPQPTDSATAPPQLRRSGGDLPNRFGSRRAARLGGLTAGPEQLLRTQAAAPPEPVDPPADPLTDTAAARPMPGYPFYIAGQTGHRPPQAPYDIARDANGALLSGGLGRHVVRAAGREAGISLPQAAAQQDATLAATLSDDPDQRDPAAERQLERLRAQILAKAVAMGDMTAHLEDARIETLPPDGTPLEQAAMAFHHDGAGLAMLNPAGNGAATLAGGYRTPRAPVPGGTAPAADGIYQVNGAAPKPGAPFADPCGVAPVAGRDLGLDPLTGQNGFTADAAMIGFRRYEASAVQLDMVVNKAGWHDPQARINVLTAKSDAYKLGEGIISPKISDQDEPFFFRALSGECLEFRHTNELPKDLALDDFQVRTPTDTIGQHIHLVKFDVTSSDGSGNGWNYEDGTFAPDELMARRCAATELTAFGGGADLALWGTRLPETGECAALNNGQVWRRQLGADGPPFEGSSLTNRDLFQTTAQRWFADPILTKDGAGKDVDRTMRTVFSHDHFGPSSIQQHGFYTALLIEPHGGAAVAQKVCDILPEPDGSCTDLAPDMAAVADSPEGLVGASRLIDMGKHDPLHPNYREFALAIADFALLYDPRDRGTEPPAPNAPWAAADAPLKGIAQIYCEANFGTRNSAAGMERACASGLTRQGDRFFAAGEGVPPAWVVAGRPGDYPAHRGDLWGNLFLTKNALDAHGDPVAKSDAQILRERLLDHRFAAAFPTPAAQAVGRTRAARLAQPVAGPDRPESISVDHHDPYLVNYRMAAVPLRLGTRNANGSPSPDCALYPMSPPGQAGASSPVVSKLVEGSLPSCSFRYQLAGPAGDAAFAFSSRSPVLDAQSGTYPFDPARDPETPIFEGYQNDRLVFRLIQGAQEVQHVFNIAGLPFRRNIDQIYPQAMRPLATLADPARSACFAAVRRSHPQEYDDWLAGDIRDLSDLDPAEAQAEIALAATPADKARLERWRKIAQALARCDNLEGMVYAQEVGISEHFEMRGRLRQDVVTSPERIIAPETPDGGTGGDLRHRGRGDVTDYLYSFGTLDSLWNGDWGLVRIYRDARVRDARLGEAAAAGADEQIGKRLRVLRQYGRELAVAPADTVGEDEEASIMPGAAISSAGLPTCPMALPGRNLRYSTGYVVALRSGDLATDAPAANRGTDYGMGQYDRDGLMLALLPDLPDAPPGTGWGAINRDAVLAAVRAQYARPEPFVMRVNAGDCVVLRFVNTLAESRPGAGIRDVLGDALMPPITPLNTDPAPAVEHAGNQGELQPTTTPETGLRPSARLALTLGLPGGAAAAELPYGFGLNAPPIEAAQDGMAPISPEFAFYAGRVAYRGWKNPEDLGCVIEDTPLPGQIDACVVQMVGDRLAALRQQHGLTDAPAMVLAMDNADAPGAAGFTYHAGPTAKLLRLDSFETTPPRQWLLRADMAEPFQPLGAADPIATRLCPPGMAIEACAAALRGLADSIAAESVQAHMVLADSLLHWIPYAYGPVPLRVTGDMISQPAHGMFGVVDVLPRHWPLPDAAIPLETDAGAGITRQIMARLGLAVPSAEAGAQARAMAPVPGFGQGRAYQVSMSPAEGDADPLIRLREFVLFYQDGLNLRDARSAMVWRRAGGGPLAFQVGPPVPDCAVCDDSYDRGEQGVSYRSAGYVPRLREMGAAGLERHHDLNARVFPPDFFRRPGDDGKMPLRLQACQGEQVVIRVIHPGGRARQRAFVMNGLGYDDLFPGFGFPNAALLAPGKAVSAWLTPRQLDLGTARQPVSFLWGDGPGTLAGGGTWGLLDMLPPGAVIGDETCPEPS